MGIRRSLVFSPLLNDPAVRALVMCNDPNSPNLETASDAVPAKDFEGSL